MTVVPFYTYLHYVEPASLERLSDAIRARGGTPIAPVGMLVPLSYTDAQVACLARRTLLAHPEAWPWQGTAPRRMLRRVPFDRNSLQRAGRLGVGRRHV